MGRTFRGNDRAKKVEQYRKSRKNRKNKRVIQDERNVGRDDNRRPDGVK